MTEPLKVKGTYLRATADFVAKRFSPADQERVLARLPPDGRELLRRIDKSAWYPLPYVVGLFHGIEEVNADPERTVTDIRACGKFIANEAANTFLKLLLRVLTPKLFSRQFPEFWRKYNSFGDLKVDLTRFDENRVRFTVTGYDYVHCIGAGWIEYVFESLGKKDIVVATNVPVGTRTLPEVAWEVTWR
jgi:hypothetical protein